MTSARTFLVTGGNTGIGRATAVELARAGGRVYIACRSPELGAAAVAAIKAAADSETVWLLPLNLASLASVRECAAAFLDRDEPLHVLVNNAGVGGHRGGVTEDGFEIHFGVNHLGHFALTRLLLDRLRASGQGATGQGATGQGASGPGTRGPGARVVTVSSEVHYDARGVDFGALRRRGSFSGIREYAVSKLCNVLFTQELARREDPDSVTAYALHPGVVASDIWRRVPWPARSVIKRSMITTEQGSRTSVHCATSPEVASHTGLFYDNCQVKDPSPVATPELAGQLWKHSEEWTGLA